jgi:hypothetical protein
VLPPPARPRPSMSLTTASKGSSTNSQGSSRAVSRLFEARPGPPRSRTW